VKKYLVFKINGDMYAMSIDSIRTIEIYSETTRVPNTPKHIVGALNLRGDIMPVISSRELFGLKEAEHADGMGRIITLSKEKPLGLVVDETTVVMDIPVEDIETVDAAVQVPGNEFFSGIAKVNDDIVLIVSVEKLEEVLSEDISNFSYKENVEC